MSLLLGGTQRMLGVQDDLAPAQNKAVFPLALPPLTPLGARCFPHNVGTLTPKTSKSAGCLLVLLRAEHSLLIPYISACILPSNDT